MVKQQSTRRANGEGQPFYVKARRRWLVYVELPPGPDGERRRRKLTAASRAAALERARALRDTLRLGLPAPDTRYTVGDLLDDWLATLPGSDLAASTVDTYQRVARVWLKPYLGRVRAGELRPAHVKGALDALEAEGKSASTRRSARAVLRNALAWAHREELIAGNAAARARGPKVTAPPVEPLTLEELHRLFAVADADRLGAGVILAALLGLRRGELVGLRWEDVDLDGTPPTLRVQRQLQRLPRRGLVVQPLKTEQSQRRLVLPAMAVEVLRQHRAQCRAELLLLGVRAQASGWVFTTPQQTPLDPRSFARLVARLAVDAGLGHVHPHRLRHSAVALLLEAAVPLEIVSEIVGHSSIRLTKDTYGRLTMATKARAAGLLDAHLAADAGGLS